MLIQTVNTPPEIASKILYLLIVGGGIAAIYVIFSILDKISKK
jgi:hypothetical protein